MLNLLIENIAYTGPAAAIVAAIAYFKFFKSTKIKTDAKPKDMAPEAINVAIGGADTIVNIADNMTEKGNDHNVESVEILSGISDPNTIQAEEVNSDSTMEDINSDFDNKGF